MLLNYEQPSALGVSVWEVSSMAGEVQNFMALSEAPAHQHSKVHTLDQSHSAAVAGPALNVQIMHKCFAG